MLVLDYLVLSILSKHMSQLGSAPQIRNSVNLKLSKKGKIVNTVQIVLLICPIIWEGLEHFLLDSCHVLLLAFSTMGRAGPVHYQHPSAKRNVYNGSGAWWDLKEVAEMFL